MRLLSLFALAASLPTLAQVSNLQLSTASLSFTATVGASLPQSQIFGVTATGASLPLTISSRYLTATEGWITTTADNTTTPANVTVTANSAGLSPGIYTGQVLVVASGTQSGIVTVTLTVNSAGGSGGLISASPAAVTLASSNGQSVQSAVTLSSSGFVAFQVFTTTSTGGNWLSFSSGSNTAPTTLTIIANTVGLAAGTYTGTVSVAPLNGSAGVAIPVTLTIGAGGLGGFSASPASLSFVYQTGAANPSPQSAFVNNASGVVSYVASSSVSWARMTSNINATPGQTVTGTSNSNLVVYADPTGLSPGTYNATITVNASTGASQTISVTLTISGSSVLTASPSSFLFTYSPDTGVPLSQQAVISASGTPLSFTASANSTGWLLVGPQSGSTSGSSVLTISVNPIGLAVGTYSGSIIVTSGITPLTIPVSLTVAASGFNRVSANPPALTFQSQVGATESTQTLFLTANTTINFVASATMSGGNWLQVSPNAAVTPASLLVSVNPAAAGPAGVYNGQILIANLTDGTQLAVPVIMTLSGAPITANPPSVNFSLLAGTASTSYQTVEVGGGTSTVFTASSNASWLTVSPSTGTTPSSITVSANATSLAAGVYNGAIAINSSSGPISIPVSLTVTATALPLLTPSSLVFQYTTGSDRPALQTMAASSTGPPIAINISARTDSGGNWLSASPASGTTPVILTVGVNPDGLAPGTYRGTITATSVGTADIRTAQVLLTVTAPAGPVLTSALHGAIRQISAITPGMILSLQGNGLGPATGVSATLTPAGAVESSLNGFRALFDGIPAPVLFSGANRMDVVAPYAIAGRLSTRLVVENSGVRSSELELRLSPDAAPGVFTADGSGRGQAAALNENGSANSPLNPASAFGQLVFYATGEGQTRPGGQDGRVIATDLRVPLLPVAVNIGGVPVEVVYAGSAPQQISGMMQINVRLNPQVPRGPSVPLELRVGPAPSQPGVTVAIQ